MALLAELSKGLQPIPEFPEYISRIQFTPTPPPGTSFAEARADRYNPGVTLPLDGSFPAVEYNMHVDDNLYATAGIDQINGLWVAVSPVFKGYWEKTNLSFDPANLTWRSSWHTL
jgi:hypothetical protein